DDDAGRRIVRPGAALDQHHVLALMTADADEPPEVVALEGDETRAVAVMDRGEAHFGGGGRLHVLLAPGDEGGVGPVAEPLRPSDEVKGAVLEAEPRRPRIAQGQPVE